MKRGYVPLWRKTLDSGLIQQPKALALFVHLLLNATHEPYKHVTASGVVVLKAGEWVTGRKVLARELKQDESSIRRSLKLLQKLEIVTIKPTSKFSIISFVNWDKYRLDNKSDQQTTNKRPASDQQVTTEQQQKNSKTLKEYSTSFETLWAGIPKGWTKGNKKEAYDQYVKCGHNADYLLPIAINHVAAREAKEGRGDFAPQLKHLCRWIKNRCWEDEIEAQVDKPKTKCQDGDHVWKHDAGQDADGTKHYMCKVCGYDYKGEK